MIPSSQSLAMSSPANIIFFDGPRGNGKTLAQIMYFRQFVNMGYGKYWKGVILDQEGDDLDDVIGQSERELYKFNDCLLYTSDAADE